MSATEYLIDTSAFWRLDRDADLEDRWNSHLRRGLVWICPPVEIEICRKASKARHDIYLKDFQTAYVRTEIHQDAGFTARKIQVELINNGTASGVGPVDLLVAATAVGYGYTVLSDDADYAIIKTVRQDLRIHNVGDGPIN